MDKEIEELIAVQSQVLTMLALRVSVLEKLLLEKKIITDDDLVRETDVHAKEFLAKTNQVFKAAESKVK